MDELVYDPAALVKLEVDATATANADPAFSVIKNDKCPEQARSYRCHVYEYQ